jgi:hypothetical protein
MGFMLETTGSIGSEIFSGRDSQSSSSSNCSSMRSSNADHAAEEHRCLAILHGHEGNVISLALAGDMLYSGSDRGDIQAWKNNPQFRKAKRFGSGEGSVKSLVVVDDKVISAHQDCKIRVWRKSKGKSNRLHQLVISMPSMKAFLINFLTPNNNYVQVSAVAVAHPQNSLSVGPQPIFPLLLLGIL